MVAAVGAVADRLFEGEILGAAFEQQAAHRRIGIGTREQNTFADVDRGPERDGVGRIPAGDGKSVDHLLLCADKSEIDRVARNALRRVRHHLEALRAEAALPPPRVERGGLQLKGIQDAPRVYSVDWRRMEFMAAGEDLPPRRLLPWGKTRTALGAGILALAVVVALGALVLSRAPATVPRGAAGVLPPHGAQLFDADFSPAGGSREFVSVGNAQDHVLFTGDAIRFEVSPASWAAISIANLSPDDFVAEFAVRPVSGEGSVALYFRGSAGRQDQVVVTPSTGEITIQVTQSFEADAAPQRLFGPASRIPSSRNQQTDLVASAHGRDIVVFLSGAEIARSTDSIIASGAIGVVANATRNQSLVIELRALRVYNR